MTRAPRRPAASPPAATAALLRLDADPPADTALWTHLAWAAVALFAAALALIMARVHRIGDIYTETDFYGSYGLGARMIEHGHFDPSRYAVVGPVHEVALALVGFVVRDLFVAAELLSAIAMCAATLLWLRVARARVGAAAGLVAVLFLVTNGTWLRYGYSATTDALAIALQALFAALLLTGESTPRRLFTAGLVGALAMLTRYNAVALLPAGLIVILARGAAPSTLPRARAALLVVAGFVSLLAPWLVYSLSHGAHAGIQLHHNIAYEVFARARHISWDEYEHTMQSQFPTPWSVFARDPGAVTLHMFFNLFDHFRLDMIQLTRWPLALTGLAGFAIALRTGALAPLAPVLTQTALFFLTLVPAFYSERYALAVLPGWALLAGVAVASPRFAGAFRVAGRGVWLKALVAVLPVGLSLQASVALQQQQARYLPLEALTIARAVKPLLRPGDRVMARKSYFAWHAGLEAVPFPFADSLGQLAAAARREHARWLYFSWPEAELRPAFEYLLDTTNAVPGLVPRAVTRHNPAVLYEITSGFGGEPAWSADPHLLSVARARARVLITDNDWHSRVLVALEEQRQGRYDRAQPLLEDAQRIVPAELAVLLPLGENLVRLRRANEANDVFVRAEQVEPGNAQARIGRGWAVLLMEHPQEAGELWKPVIALTDDMQTLERMQQLYTFLKDADGATAVRQRLTEMGTTR